MTCDKKVFVERQKYLKLKNGSSPHEFKYGSYIHELTRTPHPQDFTCIRRSFLRIGDILEMT